MPDVAESPNAHALSVLRAKLAATEANPHLDVGQNLKDKVKERKVARLKAEISALEKEGK